MSKIEYPSLAMWYVVKPRYISTSPKQKLRNNIDVIDYFAGDNEMSRPKSASVKDIDIDIADILNQKYRYRIDIGHGDNWSTSTSILHWLTRTRWHSSKILIDRREDSALAEF